MTSIQKHALVLSLRKAFTGNRFDLSGIFDAALVAGVRLIEHPNYPVLKAMHCKTWGEIGEHKEELLRLTAEVFGYTGPLALVEVTG